MKKLILLTLTILAFTSISCSSDDETVNNQPVIANIKLEITTTRNTGAIITTTLNNDTLTEETENLPYSFIYAQQNITTGTYVKLTFLEDGIYVIGPGGSNWTDYTAELKILVNDVIVKTESFDIDQTNSELVRQIEYTF